MSLLGVKSSAQQIQALIFRAIIFYGQLAKLWPLTKKLAETHKPLPITGFLPILQTLKILLIVFTH